MVARFVLLSLVLSSSIAVAQTQRMDPGNPYHDEWGGDRNTLPVHCLVTKEQAVAAALALDPTQAAIQAFGSRGYVRAPEGDRMFLHCGQSSQFLPSTTVVLAYWAPSFTGNTDSTIIAPHIVVTTVLEPTTGEPYTHIMGGSLAVDESIFPADSLYPSHVSFFTEDTWNVGGGGPIGRIAPESTCPPICGPTPRFIVREYSDAFLRWGKCRNDTAGLCFRNGLITASITLAIARQFTPQATAIALLTCYVTGVVDCFPMSGSLIR